MFVKAGGTDSSEWFYPIRRQSTLPISARKAYWLAQRVQVEMTGNRPEMPAVLTGGCMCGAVRYRISAVPIATGHCDRCRPQSGSAFSTIVLINRSTIEIEGETVAFDDVGSSGLRVARRYCPRGGSPGGRSDPAAPYLDPTIIYPVTWDDPIMEDEVFGPILPILTYQTLDEALGRIAATPYPLAAFIFSREQKTIDRFIGELSFGGGAVNQVNILCSLRQCRSEASGRPAWAVTTVNMAST